VQPHLPVAFPAEGPAPQVGGIAIAIPVAREVVAEAVERTGFDPLTGQILDPARFQTWKQQKPFSTPATGTASNASLMEVFRKGRLAIEHWVDDDNHGPLVVRGNTAEIAKLPEMCAIFDQFADCGPVMKEKLLKHLAFMVENRRRYYLACAAAK
jgi:hypothetical protein